MAEPEADGSGPSKPQSPSTSHPPFKSRNERARWDEYNQQLVSQLEQRLNQLEAVRNYPAVKNDRDEALNNLSQAKIKISELEGAKQALGEKNSELEEKMAQLLGGTDTITDHGQDEGAGSHQRASGLPDDRQQNVMFGKLIRDAMNDPEANARFLSAPYAVSFIKVVAEICRARGINPPRMLIDDEGDDLLSMLDTIRHTIESELHPDNADSDLEDE